MNIMKRTILPAAVLAVLGITPAWGGTPTPSITSEHNLNSTITKDERQKDIDDLTQKIIQNPNDSSLYEKRLNDYVALNNTKKALEDANIMLKIDPRNPTFHNERGIIYLDMAKKNKHPDYYSSLAIEDFSEVVQYAKKKKNYMEEGYWHTGEAYALSGDYDKAHNMMDSAMRFFPDDPETYCHVALIYKWKEKYDDAVTAMNKAISFDTNNIINRMELADILEKKKSYKDAIDEYTFIINTFPKINMTQEIYSMRADCYDALGQHDAAERDRAFLKMKK